MAMDPDGYREYPAPGILSNHFVCLWTSTMPAESAPRLTRILPDGCVDLVMVDHREPIVAGPATQPVNVEFSPGTVIVGARLRPGSAPSWLGVEASSLLNQDVPLFDLWGYAARALWDELGSQGSPQARLQHWARVLAVRRLLKGHRLRGECRNRAVGAELA